MLGAALEHDYIPVWHPDWEGAGALFTDKVGCDGGKYHNFLCYFEPLSVCGYEYVTKENSHFTDSADPPFGFKTDDVPSFWRDRLTEFHRNQNGGGDIGLTRAYFKFWWRAQGSAYIMRLNGATRSKLLQMRLDTKYNEGIVVGDSSSGTNVTVPFPLPSGTINAHVRHGDKGSEMKLIPLQDYIIAAERFVSENPLSYKPILFLSTEDQECIDQAHSLGFTIKTQPASKWIVFWSNINRGNTSPYAQLEKFGRSKMMFEWLLQLWMALECDVFIGTLGSNWNRLIAQLRCTMVDKCQNPYFEVGTGESWVDYNW